ncbi:hypothetical protein D3C76_1741140 [compost metagenome]
MIILFYRVHLFYFDKIQQAFFDKIRRSLLQLLYCVQISLGGIDMGMAQCVLYLLQSSPL